MTDFWTDALVNTLIVMLGVGLLTFILAVPLAWLTERSDVPGAPWLRQLFTLPYVIPSYLLAVAWITLANPSVGWINRLFAHEEPLINIYGLWGIILIEASALFAIFYLGLRTTLKRIDPAFEEAARLAGASPFAVFTTITLPLIKNSILLSWLAVALASLASFGVPAMIGGPARKFVLTTGIYSLIKQGSQAAFFEALSVAWKMALATLLVVLIVKFFSSSQVGSMGGRVSRPALVALGKKRLLVGVAVWSVWLALIAIPLAVLILSSFQRDPSSFAIENFGLNSWKKVFLSLPNFPEAVKTSFITAIFSALIVALLGLAVGLLRWHALYYRKHSLRFGVRAFEESAFLLYSIPGTVLALLLITASARLYQSIGVSLSNTFYILVLAYVLKYLSLGIGNIIPSVQLIHPTLIESARLSGAGAFSRLWHIWLPLVKPALIAGALLVFMPSLSELTMTVLLYGPGTQNLGVLLFEQQEYADRASAAVIGSLLLFVVFAIQIVLGRLQREP